MFQSSLIRSHKDVLVSSLVCLVIYYWKNQSEMCTTWRENKIQMFLFDLISFFFILHSFSSLTYWFIINHPSNIFETSEWKSLTENEHKICFRETKNLFGDLIKVWRRDKTWSGFVFFLFLNKINEFSSFISQKAHWLLQFHHLQFKLHFTYNYKRIV